MDVVKIHPPLIIGGEGSRTVSVTAFDAVLSDCRKFPGPMWELGKNFFKSSLGFAKAK